MNNPKKIRSALEHHLAADVIYELARNAEARHELALAALLKGFATSLHTEGTTLHREAEAEPEPT